MDATRALLDSLMGPDRNAAPAPVKKGKEAANAPPDFAKSNVCKNFLVGFCPHDWFSKGRALRPCEKIHSELLRGNMEAHPDAEAYTAEYEEEFLNYLEACCRECDLFIVRERAKCRGAGGQILKMPDAVKEKHDDTEKKYKALIQKSEDLAEESVARSKDYLGQALVMKEELDTIKAKYTTDFAGEDICEVCGVRYPLGDGHHDKTSHYRGKTHQGFKQIRDKIAEIKSRKRGWEKQRKRIEELREKRRKWEEAESREKKKSERERDREREEIRRQEREQRERERREFEKKEATRREVEKKEAEKRKREDEARAKEEAKRKEAEKKKRDEERARERERRRSRSPRPTREPLKMSTGISDRELESMWERLQRLPPSECQAELAKLDGNTHDRLEAWLKKRMQSREEQPPPPPPDDSENLEALWERLQKLPPSECQAALAALSDAQHDRLQEYLQARVSAR